MQNRGAGSYDTWPATVAQRTGYRFETLLDGGDGNDYLDGGYGHDVLKGGSGSDYLFGYLGNDTLFGGDGVGIDTLDGGSGDDNLYVQTEGSFAFGNTGRDYIVSGDLGNYLHGGADDDNLYGNGGDDALSGDSGNDLLFGGSGDDWISGGDGNDRIIGGTGVNVLTGGNGSDLFVIDDHVGSMQIINDFKPGEDKLSLEQVATLPSNNSRYSYSQYYYYEALRLIASGSDTIVILPGGGQATVKGVSISQFDASFFVKGYNPNPSRPEFQQGTARPAQPQTTNLSQLASTVTLPGTRLNLIDVTPLTTVQLDPLATAASIPLETIQRDNTLPPIYANSPAPQYEGTIHHFTGTIWGKIPLNILNDAKDPSISQRYYTSTSPEKWTQGSSGNDTILGSETNQLLAGNDGNDSITGSVGADMISGGNGNDFLDGGPGNDTIAGGLGSDRINSGRGADTIVYQSINDSTGLSPSTMDVILAFEKGSDIFDLSALGNQNMSTLGLLPKNWAASVFTFNNIFQSIVGNDSYFGITGTDFKVKIQDQRVTFTSSDFIFSSPNSSLINQSKINQATSGDDNILGDDANNIIAGLDGYDRIEAGLGNDSIDGGNGNDILFGQNGNDSILGGEGNDTLLGGEGDDFLNGGNGDDVLFGGVGADLIQGWGGHDVIVYASLDDSKQSAMDILQTFEPGYEKIDISYMNQTYAFADIYQTQENGNTYFGISNTQFKVELLGQHVLSNSDFIFQ